MTSPNQTLETNCRPASPLNAGRQFGRAVHARPCVSGGGRSTLHSARFHHEHWGMSRDGAVLPGRRNW